MKERVYTGLARNPSNPSVWEAEAGQLLEFEVGLNYKRKRGELGLLRTRPLAQNTTDNRVGEGLTKALSVRRNLLVS